MNRNKKVEAKRKKTRERNARQAAYRAAVRNRPRKCGECRVCCFVFPLLDKPERCWCRHVTGEGCGCYEDRPAVCRNYRCAYLKEKAFPDSWRPDRSGVIITRRGSFRGHPVLYLSAVWDGALERAQGERIVSVLSGTNAIVVYRKEDRYCVCCASRSSAVLNAEDGVNELMEYLQSDTEAEMAKITEEPFDFGGRDPATEVEPEQRPSCSPRQEARGQRDPRAASLKIVVASTV